jgi:hypothetical protein
MPISSARENVSASMTTCMRKLRIGSMMPPSGTTNGFRYTAHWPRSIFPVRPFRVLLGPVPHAPVSYVQKGIGA